MADDISNNEGMGEAGDAGMPDDLKRLLARAEQGEDGDPDAYNPDADDDEEEDDDGELEESFGEVDRGASAGEDINGGQLQISEFGREMKQSFIEYSMSVITARALPDVRDGLKPVHRRILYAMNESGIYPNRPHKKSAWTVGEVIGKYHPHGDFAVYEAMVRLAQWFSMRTPLIDGHGNFGNIDGDGAAAMRYTESRLAKPAMELLRDLQKDTVDWQPNYDESLAEPVALPRVSPTCCSTAARASPSRKAHQYRPAQPHRGDRGHLLPDRQSRRHRRRTYADHARSGLPHRRHHHGQRRH